jgi:hypothetical protein
MATRNAKQSKTQPVTPRSTAQRLAGDIILDQGFQLVLHICPSAPVRWFPSPAAVIHYTDGAEEPASMKTLKRPKVIDGGKEYYVSADRDGGDPVVSRTFLYLSLENDGAPLEIWDESAAATPKRKKKAAR